MSIQRLSHVPFNEGRAPFYRWRILCHVRRSQQDPQIDKEGDPTDIGDKIHSMAVISDTMAIFFIVIVFAIKISYCKIKYKKMILQKQIIVNLKYNKVNNLNKTYLIK